MRPLIVPVFIPGLGCRQRCIYCDQRAVTGAPPRLPGPEEIWRTLSLYLATPKARRAKVRQLAFYGGTFTQLPESDQERLLAIGRGYIDRGLIDSLRLSTRPDALDAPALLRLAAWGVRTIELGAQSFDEGVLRLARRGHSAQATEAAARLIKASGLELGLQLMCGLPGEDLESFLASCRRAAALSPALVRLYPVVVLRGTELERWWRRGDYLPLSVAQAVDWCRRALESFAAQAIPVARIGLPASRELEAAVVAGPYHPALGDLVRSPLRLASAQGQMSAGRA